MPITFAPASAAAHTAKSPPVPQPTTTMSASTVWRIWDSAISGGCPSQSEGSSSEAFPVLTTSTGISPLACWMHFFAAAITAFDVIVAPETASISEA